MCIACDGNVEGITELDWCGRCDISHIEGLKKLDCDYTQVTSIPHIEGLKILNCSNIRVISIPDIKTITHKLHNDCPFLDPVNIQHIINAQSMIRRHLKAKKIIRIRNQLIPIYYHPDMKGGYFAKREIMNNFEAL